MSLEQVTLHLQSVGLLPTGSKGYRAGRRARACPHVGEMIDASVSFFPELWRLYMVPLRGAAGWRTRLWDVHGVEVGGTDQRGAPRG